MLNLIPINDGKKYEHIIERVFRIVYGRTPNYEPDDEDNGHDDDDDILVEMSAYFCTEANLDIDAMSANWKAHKAGSAPTNE